MTTPVLLAVLFAALLHASWNVLVKRQHDKLMATAGVYLGSSAIALLVLPWLPLPAAAAWPFLLASALVQMFYGVLLARAYQQGDLSYAYPLMRGTPPLLVAVGGVLLAHETLSLVAVAGIALVSAGIVSLLLAPRKTLAAAPHAAATRAALLNACVIACYTLLDGIGIRKSGTPLAYILWLFLVTGVAWLGWTILGAGRERQRALLGDLPRALIGGTCSLGSYGIALWAMTQAPIATVAAVRETSIIFGLILGWLVLNERITRTRAMAGVLVTLGVYLIRGGA